MSPKKRRNAGDKLRPTWSFVSLTSRYYAAFRLSAIVWRIFSHQFHVIEKWAIEISVVAGFIDLDPATASLPSLSGGNEKTCDHQTEQWHLNSWSLQAENLWVWVSVVWHLFLSNKRVAFNRSFIRTTCIRCPALTALQHLSGTVGHLIYPADLPTLFWMK